MTTPLSWAECLDRFDAALFWWVATAEPGTGPHAVPVWGVVVDGAMYWYSEAASRRSRDLAIDPRVVVHLESGEEVLIARGTAALAGTAADLPEVSAAYRPKYPSPEDAAWLPDQPDWAHVQIWRFVPMTALTWDLVSIVSSQRRWSAT